jgi:hypothetical protein
VYAQVSLVSALPAPTRSRTGCSTGITRLETRSISFASVPKIVFSRPWKCPYCTDLLTIGSAALHMLEVHEQSSLGYAASTERFPAMDCVSVPMRGKESYVHMTMTIDNEMKLPMPIPI